MDKHPQPPNILRFFAPTLLIAFTILMAVPLHAGQSQSIRFDSLPVLRAGTADVSPSVQASSSLPVSLASSDTTVVSIVDGKLRPKQAGWTRLTARQPGDAQYDPAPEVVQLVWVVNRPRILTTWGRWETNLRGVIVVPDSLRHEVVQASVRAGTIAGVRSNETVFVISRAPELDSVTTFSMPNVAKVRVGCDGTNVVAIRKDGSTRTWGQHRRSHPSEAGSMVPDSLNHGIVDMQFLYDYAIALRSDGTVFGVDTRTWKAWDVPTSILSGVTAMDLTCLIDEDKSDFSFLRADGSLVTWNLVEGVTTSNLPDSMKTNIRSIAGGVDFLVAVDRKGRAMEWTRQGLRGGTSGLPKAQLSSGVVSVSADGDYAVALKQDGSMVPWGRLGYSTGAPDSLLGGSMEVFAANAWGFAALGRLKPALSFTAPSKTNWGDGDIEAGLVLQRGRAPVFSSSNDEVADFKEGRILVKHVGTTTLTVSYPGDSLWLPAGPISRSLTVATRRIIVQGQKAQKVFGDADPSLTYSCAQCGPLDVLTGNLERAGGESVGTYLVKQGSLRASRDHDLVFVSDEFIIQPRKIAVLADSVVKPAGAPDPVLTFRVDGILEGDTLAGSLSRQGGEDPGSYPILLGSLEAGENYVIDFRGANLQISATSGLVSRPMRMPAVREVHAAIRHPFVERSMSAHVDKGLAPDGAADRGGAILDVLLPAAGQVEVSIFDNAGTPVQSWSGEIGQARWQQLPPTADGRRRLAMSWDLKSRSGASVSDGVYLCRVLVRTDSGSKLEQVLRIGVR
ncbi:MAG: hypothetical protein IPK50_10060 [Fibrobacterota bacterium]|nr:hypothetical protein [Fibrobacterota bacterium]QQS07222.1 MAG: hypothetical protein IPK50_10060 [Fibrobacterota bacterium]